MYLDAADAKSDFFLAAAVYVVGPTLIALLTQTIPVLASDGLIGRIVLVLVPILTISAMPLFLMRYRDETYQGLLTGGRVAFGLGFGVAAVFAGALLVGEFLAGADVAGALTSPAPLLILAAILRWVSLGILAIFLWRRAEYAFRPISEQQQTLVRQAGLACVGTIMVSTVLLLLAAQPIWALLPAAGLAGMFFLAERQLPQQGVGERWWVWAPVITLVLGPLQIFSALFDGRGFLASAQQAAAVGLFGLVVVMALDKRRGGLVAFGMAGAFIIANLAAFAGGTGFFV